MFPYLSPKGTGRNDVGEDTISCTGACVIQVVWVFATHRQWDSVFDMETVIHTIVPCVYSTAFFYMCAVLTKELHKNAQYIRKGRSGHVLECMLDMVCLCVKHVFEAKAHSKHTKSL